MFEFEQTLINNQSLFRMGFFFLILGLLFLFEHIWPRRLFDKETAQSRQMFNLLLLLINIIALRVCVPLAAFEVAIYMAEQNIGLMHILALPLWLNIFLSIVLFDFMIYIQHVAFHYFKLLWRIHRVHHTDLQFDVTTGVRFHPLEIVLSMFYKILGVAIFGPAAVAVIIYEILLNVASLFTHSNVNLNQHIDTILRRIIVTPDMHRVHHSVLRQETDSNYGNLFSFWDKLFKTYHAQPEAGHDGMQIGLSEFRDAEQVSLKKILLLPFQQREDSHL